MNKIEKNRGKKNTEKERLACTILLMASTPLKTLSTLNSRTIRSILKSQHTVTFYSKYSRALTFENVYLHHAQQSHHSEHFQGRERQNDSLFYEREREREREHIL